jgi:hypothetical protein
VLLLVVGFWGSEALAFGGSIFQYFHEFLATSLGAFLGIPAGLEVSRRIEAQRSRQEDVNVLESVESELRSNSSYIQLIAGAIQSRTSLNSPEPLNQSKSHLLVLKLHERQFISRYSGILVNEVYLSTMATLMRLSNRGLYQSILNAYTRLRQVRQGMQNDPFALFDPSTYSQWSDDQLQPMIDRADREMVELISALVDVRQIVNSVVVQIQAETSRLART